MSRARWELKIKYNVSYKQGSCGAERGVSGSTTTVPRYDTHERWRKMVISQIPGEVSCWVCCYANNTKETTPWKPVSIQVFIFSPVFTSFPIQVYPVMMYQSQEGHGDSGTSPQPTKQNQKSRLYILCVAFHHEGLECHYVKFLIHL